MSALILDGKAVAQKTETELTGRVAAIRERSGRTPILATILVGDDPASATYVRMKQNACKRIGMESIAVEMWNPSCGRQMGWWERLESRSSSAPNGSRMAPWWWMPAITPAVWAISNSVRSRSA